MPQSIIDVILGQGRDERALNPNQIELNKRIQEWNRQYPHVSINPARVAFSNQKWGWPREGTVIGGMSVAPYDNVRRDDEVTDKMIAGSQTPSLTRNDIILAFLRGGPINESHMLHEGTHAAFKQTKVKLPKIRVHAQNKQIELGEEEIVRLFDALHHNNYKGAKEYFGLLGEKTGLKRPIDIEDLLANTDVINSLLALQKRMQGITTVPSNVEFPRNLPENFGADKPVYPKLRPEPSFQREDMFREPVGPVYK